MGTLLSRAVRRYSARFSTKSTLGRLRVGGPRKVEIVSYILPKNRFPVAGWSPQSAIGDLWGPTENWEPAKAKNVVPWR
jgi:hypothetical protein